jgi:hypothetical protein
MSPSIRTDAHAAITAACDLASDPSEAQSVCDELSIDHAWYGALTDTAMEVGVLHGGSSFLSYPVFNIVDHDSRLTTFIS